MLALAAELQRAALLLLPCALLGLIFNLPFAGISVGMFLLGAWHLRQAFHFQRWISSSIQPVPDVLRGFWRELTAPHKRLRTSSRNRIKTLLEQLRRFQATSVALPDAVVLLSDNGEIVWFNAVARELLGLVSTDTGRKLAHLIRHPELVKLLQQQGDEGFLEIESPLEEGKILDFRRAQATSDLLLLLVRDTTEIQQLMTMRQDFIANVSHELRTPLTVIIGYLETLTEDSYALDSAEGDIVRIDPSDKLDDLDEQQVKDALQALHREHTMTLDLVQRIQSPAQRMRALVDDLLLLSKLDTPRAPLMQTQPVVEVPQLVRSLVNEAQSLSAGKHELIAHIDTGLYIYGSEQELHSAFNNLIVNAVRYSPDGGAINVLWQRDSGGGAHFCVSDEGLGIPPEHIERLTERFYRVDVGRSRGAGGTGLGLAIVKHVLRRHDSELKIDSISGKGSEFSCNFAAERVTSNPREQARDQDPIA